MMPGVREVVLNFAELDAYIVNFGLCRPDRFSNSVSLRLEFRVGFVRGRLGGLSKLQRLDLQSILVSQNEFIASFEPFGQTFVLHRQSGTGPLRSLYKIAFRALERIELIRNFFFHSRSLIVR